MFLKPLAGCRFLKEKIILNHVFKINSATSPNYMIVQFVQASFVHSYSTGFRVNKWLFFSPKNVKNVGKKSFAYRGCIL